MLKFEQEIKYISEIVQPWSMLQIIIVELTASQLHSETGFEPVPAFLGNSVRVYCSTVYRAYAPPIKKTLRQLQ